MSVVSRAKDLLDACCWSRESSIEVIDALLIENHLLQKEIEDLKQHILSLKEET